jgi:hypothetical protein
MGEDIHDRYGVAGRAEPGQACVLASFKQLGHSTTSEAMQKQNLGMKYTDNG